jgi:hypothetical protein
MIYFHLCNFSVYNFARGYLRRSEDETVMWVRIRVRVRLRDA